MALLQIRVELALLLVALVLGFSLDIGFGHQGHHHSRFCASRDYDHEPRHAHHHNDHQCGIGHGHGHLLPEELAEEENLKLFGFGLQHDHDHNHDHWHHYIGAPTELSGLAFNCINATRMRWVTDIEGLQIRKDGMWNPAQPLPNAFIINIGDTLEMVTNGIYGSIEHRATVKSERRREGEKERVSIATFYGPNGEATMSSTKPCYFRE